MTQGSLRYALGPWVAGNICIGDSYSIRPDILIRRGENNLAIVDAKWKHFAAGVAQSDAYQRLAVARLYSCSRLIFLYPAPAGEVADENPPQGLAQGRERLDSVCIRLEDSEADIRNSISRLINDLV
jgi:5-methylcytosine-specific restriction enzyme subunit McrC